MARRIADVVHNSIQLSDVEYEIVESPSFQRLRGIKQLGLAHYVFPGANYSRFSHSLGVCHVTGQILDAISQNAGVEIPPKERQLYRLAGLLHDIGHYPFSHVTERAVANYHSGQMVRPKGQSKLSLDDEPEERVFKHERLGKEILTKDPIIYHALTSANIDADEVAAIFLRQSPPRFANLISSDLDADRIDYLLRTAHHTGLPYGSIDIDYLVSQMTLDGDERICVTSKALHTAEHVLLSRYFDYQRTNYHKTVAGFELVLEGVLDVLLAERRLDCRAASLSRMIEDMTWISFDDAYVIAKIRELYDDARSDATRLKARSILYRRPPRLICDYEHLSSRSGSGANEFKRHFQALVRQVRQLIPELGKEFGIDESLFFLWTCSGLALTKVGSQVSLSSLAHEGEEAENERYFQNVRVLNRDQTKSEVIIDLPRSLLSVLSNYLLYVLRLYVLLPEAEEDLRDTMRKRVMEKLPETDWR